MLRNQGKKLGKKGNRFKMMQTSEFSHKDVKITD